MNFARAIFAFLLAFSFAPSALAAPANDAFANAQILSGATGSVTGSNTTATREAGEPCHADNCGNRSVWFRWTATANGAVTFRTAGSTFDTTLGIYRGSGLGSLVEVTSDDDVAQGDVTSLATFTATAGTTYHIGLDGYFFASSNNQTSGNYVLLWEAEGGVILDNDFFAQAQTISGNTGFVTDSNVGASGEQDEPCHGFICADRSVWFRWTPSVTGPANFNTAGSSFDTLLAVYTGSSLPNLVVIAQNDDRPADLLSEVAFTAIAGTTYLIAVDGYFDFEDGQEEGDIRLNWNLESGPPPTPINDAFINALLIAGPSGSAPGTTEGATTQVGEPVHGGVKGGHSLWYRWTAPTSGEFIFETAGSAFDTVLAAYSGQDLNALTPLAANNDANANTRQSRIVLTATSGTIYSIAVDGVAGAEGNVVLSWRPNSAAIDLLPDLMAPADQARGWIYGWRFDRGSEPGRTLLRVTTGTPNVGAGALELQGNSQNPEVVQRIYRSDGSSYTRSAGTFTFHPDHGHLHFDRFMQFRLRAVGPDNSVGDVVATGAKMSFAIIDLGTYDRTLPGSPAQGRYSGGLLQGISVGYTDIYDQSISGQHIDVTDIPEGRYWLEAEVDPENRILESNEENNWGRILVDLTPPTPPANDNFAAAFQSSLTAQSWTGSTMGATAETGEPLHSNNRGSSVWFRWTAPASMPVRVTTQGSDFDTVLGVYRGSALNSLLVVGSNDDFEGVWSRVDFSAIVGTTYYIAVDGYSGATGNYVLNINPSGNDNFANAIALAGASGSIGGSTYSATREGSEPIHADVPGLNGSIWYHWTAPASGPVTFDTIGSFFNTVLGVYTGTSVSGLTRIAADNDAAGNNLSRVNFDAVADRRYYIAIDGAGTVTGRGMATLNWAPATGPCVAPEIVTVPVSGPRQLGGEITFSVVATAVGPITYQWFYSSQAGLEGEPITDSARITGANSASLRVTGIQLSDAGFFSVRVSACDPALVTRSPAAQLVVTSDVGVHVEPATGFVGQSICTEIELSASGGETSVSGTVVFDPTVLSNPRITAAAGIPPHTLNTSVAPGRIGFQFTLTGGATFSAGHHHFLELCFDAIGAANNSPIGFDSQLQAMMVMAGNVHRDNAVFAPTSITITRPTRAVGSFNAEGRFVITLTGQPGAQLRIRSATGLSGWDTGSVVTLDGSGNGSINFSRNNTGSMFYSISAE